MSQNTDSPATLQVAQEKGVFAFGWDSDMVKFAPKSHLTANTNDWSDHYIMTAKAVMAGTWKSGEVRGGLKEGMGKMSPLNPVVPAAVGKIFEEKKKAIADGTFFPFQGPVIDQAGVVKVETGKVMPLKELLSMNFYVKGVEGSIPK